MTTGMMIYLLICGLIGLALVVLALMNLIENWFISNVEGVIDRRLTAPTANRAADTVNRIEWFKAGAINVTEMPS